MHLSELWLWYVKNFSEICWVIIIISNIKKPNSSYLKNKFISLWDIHERVVLKVRFILIQKCNRLRHVICYILLTCCTMNKLFSIHLTYWFQSYRFHRLVNMVSFITVCTKVKNQVFTFILQNGKMFNMENFTLTLLKSKRFNKKKNIRLNVHKASLGEFRL